MNACTSDIKDIKTGVPQGSPLRPLLFSLCINDVVNLFPNVVVISADDTSSFFSLDTNASDFINRANAFHQQLSALTPNNSLKLNVKKTRAPFFSPKK